MAIKFVWKNEHIEDSFSHKRIDFKKETFNINNIWAKKDAGTTGETFTAKLPSHDVVLLKLSPTK